MGSLIMEEAMAFYKVQPNSGGTENYTTIFSNEKEAITDAMNESLHHTRMDIYTEESVSSLREGKNYRKSTFKWRIMTRVTKTQNGFTIESLGEE